jgi:hypothetical protein
MFRYNLGLKKDSKREDLDYDKTAAQKIHHRPGKGNA